MLLPVDLLLHGLLAELSALLELVVPVPGSLEALNADGSRVEVGKLLSKRIGDVGGLGLDEPRVSGQSLLNGSGCENLSRRVDGRGGSTAGKEGVEDAGKGRRQAVQEVDERVGLDVLGCRSRSGVKGDGGRLADEPSSDGTGDLDGLSLEGRQSEVDEVASRSVLGWRRVPGGDGQGLESGGRVGSLDRSSVKLGQRR